MRRRSLFGVACVGLLYVPFPTTGRAAPEAGSPEAVVRGAISGMNQGRIDDFTKAMHPQALEQFRTSLSGVIDAAAKEGKADELLKMFPGIKKVGDLKQLDDGQFFSKYLRGMIAINPEIKRALAGTKTETLGHFDEGKETTHVIYRSTLNSQGAKLDRVNVVSLRRDGARWAMLLTGDLDGMVSMMKQKFAGSFEFPDLTASRIEILGRLLEGDDKAQIAYRMITPMGGSSIQKSAVLTVNKADPGWPVAHLGKPEELSRLVSEKLGLGSSNDESQPQVAPAETAKDRFERRMRESRPPLRRGFSQPGPRNQGLPRGPLMRDRE